MCALLIKVPIRKNSRKLSYAPRIYIYIHVCVCVCVCVWLVGWLKFKMSFFYGRNQVTK